MNKYAVIVAGGKGMRMGGSVPKQFQIIGGRPVLMHTIEAFLRTDASIKIVLVLPREQQKYWEALCRDYHFQVPYIQADGGATRFHSVQNALRCISLCGNDALIAVHDGVRPFVSAEVINACYEAAAQSGAAVPVLDMIESVRVLEQDGQSRAADRSLLKLVQTPQTFQAGLLKQAYECPYVETFTDDASVVEASGVSVVLVAGNRENIKLTTPFDLRIAETLLTT